MDSSLTGWEDLPPQIRGLQPHLSRSPCPSQHVDEGGVGIQFVHLPQKASVEIKETMGTHLRLLLWQRLAGIHVIMCEALMH